MHGVKFGLVVWGCILGLGLEGVPVAVTEEAEEELGHALEQPVREEHVRHSEHLLERERLLLESESVC